MQERNPEFDSLVPGLPFSRRSFVGASLAAAFALAVQPAIGQGVVQTPADGLVVGDISVRGADGAVVPAYHARPAGAGPFATVLVVSEIFGVHEYIRDVCRRLARAGYLAIAPDLFRRQGDPTRIASVAEILNTVISKVPDAQVMGDLDACAAWAAANGGDAARLAGRPVGILADMQGPKIRVGKFVDNKVVLQRDAEFILDAKLAEPGNAQRVGLDYKDLPRDVKPGDVLLLDDGRPRRCVGPGCELPRRPRRNRGLVRLREPLRRRR